jgi:hypothetical protein
MVASGLRPELLDRRQQPLVDRQPVQRRQFPGQLMNLDRQQLVQQRLPLPTRQPQHPPSQGPTGRLDSPSHQGQQAY